MSGQPPLNDNPLFGLDASKLVVLDPDDTPKDNVLSRADPFKLQLTLEFSGHLARLILCCLCWEICYCFEVCCYEGTDRPGSRNFCSPRRYCGSRDKLTYDDGATEVTVPANSLAPATYRVSALVKFYCGDDGRAPYVAAFADGPVIEITD